MRSPGRPPLAALFGGIAAGVFAACSSGGDVKSDAGAEAAVDATADVAPGDGSTCTNDGGAATWTQLYTDYFGPGGKGQCGKASGCHLDGTGGGQFWICGSTKQSCYQGMQNNVLPCNAANSKMPGILRKVSEPFAPGKMPADPTTVTYDDADVAKISSWINAGAKND